MADDEHPWDQGYGGPFQFNASRDMLERARDEPEAIAIVLNRLSHPLADQFWGIASLFRARAADPNPEWQDISIQFVTDPDTAAKMLHLIEHVGARADADAAEVWRQLLGAIKARATAKDPDPDDRPG